MQNHGLELFPKNEEWATGDEHIDQSLNLLLSNCYNNLNLLAIGDFYHRSKSIRLRVNNPSFNHVIDLCTKALISLFDKNLEVDQELLKIKGCFSHYQLLELKEELDLSELASKNFLRLWGQIDFFQRFQTNHEHNPFVPFKLNRSSRYFEVKFVFKDLIARIDRGDSHLEHECLNLLAQKKIVKISDLGKLWFHQGYIYCVNS